MLTQGDIQAVDDIIADRTKLLPTKEEFFSKMDEVMGELKKTREAVELHTGQHVEIHDEQEENKRRLNRIEKHLKLPAVA